MAVPDLPSPPAANNVLASRPEEEARPRVSPTSLECRHHQWRLELRTHCGEHLMSHRRLTPDEAGTHATISSG